MHRTPARRVHEAGLSRFEWVFVVVEAGGVELGGRSRNLFGITYDHEKTCASEIGLRYIFPVYYTPITPVDLSGEGGATSS